jgi:hypothetical protein
MRAGALAPVAAGLAVALVTILAGPRLLDTRVPAEPWEVPYVVPFQGDPGAAHLVVAPLGRAQATAALAADAVEGTVVWATANVGVLEHGGGPSPEPEGAASGWVNVSAYVFLGDGSLVATNLEDPGEFRPSSYFTAIPPGMFLVEENGRVTWDGGSLPADWVPVLAALGRLVVQAPVGSVVTSTLADHPRAPDVGPLFVTLRVESREAARPAP